MLKAIIAVIAGYAVWTVIWLGGNAVLFTDAAEVVAAGQPYTAAGPLLGAVVLSVVCSLAAGYVCAFLARGRPLMILAVLLLLTGIGVQAGVWSLMPLWYHLVFLGLVVPVTMAGGRLRK